MEWLRSLPVAHRGLHDPHKGIIENSPSAFEAAARAGYAIELDVHLSADGKVIVFHDDKLDRLTKETGKTRDRTATELTQLIIEGSADTIPTLKDVLRQVAARVPILIEIKNASRTVGPLEKQVAEDLRGYYGAVAVQSFNPYSVGWFAKNAPHLRRGQISQSYEDYKDRPMPSYQKFALTHMLLNIVSRPQFVAFNCKDLPSFGPSRVRAFGLPVLAWTVKNEAMASNIAPYADNIIFENFQPPLPAGLSTDLESPA